MPPAPSRAIYLKARRQLLVYASCAILRHISQSQTTVICLLRHPAPYISKPDDSCMPPAPSRAIYLKARRQLYASCAIPRHISQSQTTAICLLRHPAPYISKPDDSYMPPAPSRAIYLKARRQLYASRAIPRHISQSQTTVICLPRHPAPYISKPDDIYRPPAPSRAIFLKARRQLYASRAITNVLDGRTSLQGQVIT